jgi:hypothetical protein
VGECEREREGERQKACQKLIRLTKKLKLKTTSLNIYIYLYKTAVRSQLGLPGSTGSRVELPGQPGPGSNHRVDWVLPGQFPNGSFHQPGPVPAPGQPDPESTCRPGPGFKTLVIILLLN